MRAFLLSTILLLSALFAWSQDTVQKLVPTNLTADAPELTIGSERGPTNLLSGSLSFSTLYDDKMTLSASGRPESDVQYLIAPSIVFQEKRRQVSWNVQYAPGISFNQRASVGTESRQAFSGTLELTPTARLRMRLRQDYLRTSNPVDFVDSPLPAMGVINSANPSIILPNTIRTSLTSTAGVSYAIDRHNEIGVSGTFAKFDYDGLTGATPSSAFMASQTALGTLYYSRQFSARGSFGLQYAFTDMNFTGGLARTQVHSFLYFQTVRLNSHSQLMLFGGGERVDSRSTALPVAQVERSTWGPVIGGMFAWTAAQYAIGLEGSRRTGDGGGVTQAVKITTGSFRINRRLSRRWTAQTSVRFSDNANLEWAAAQEDLQSMIASAGIQHSFTDNLSVDVAYNRIYQHTTGAPNALGNHNQVQLSLRYSFAKSLRN